MAESTNAMYEELACLRLEPRERTQLEKSLDDLNEPIHGRGFDDLYAEVEAHLQNVLGIKAKYERLRDDARKIEKRRRGSADIEHSQSKNPATGKAYTRDAIGALVENDDSVIDVVDARQDAVDIVNYTGYLHELYRLHYEHVVNTNVNWRKSWSAAN